MGPPKMGFLKSFLMNLFSVKQTGVTTRITMDMMAA